MIETTGTDTASVRVIVFKDGEHWVAQCIEHDIGAQADDLDTLYDRLEVVFKAEMREARERNRAVFEGIEPAPKRFHQMWERRARSLEVAPAAWMIDAMNVNLGLAA